MLGRNFRHLTVNFVNFNFRMSTKKFERLPVAVVPTHYDIWLKPDLVNFSFVGTLTAHLQVNLYVRFLTFIVTMSIHSR